MIATVIVRSKRVVVGAAVLATPWHGAADRSPERRGDRREPAGHLERVSAHEAARGIGLVELLADDAAADGPAVAAERPIEDPAHERVRMEHEVPADQAAPIGQPVGEPRRARVQQEPRRADPVGGQDDRARLLLAQASLAIVVERPVGPPVRAERDLAHAGARLEARAGRERLGPVGDVGARLRPGRAAEVAGAAVDAGAAAVVVAREDGAVRRPPVPAETIEAPGHRGPERVERDRRRLPWRLRRIGGIAGRCRPRPSCGRSDRRTAPAWRSRWASRRPRRRGCAPGSPRGGSAGSERSSGSCCRPRRCTSAARSASPRR